LSYGLVAAEGDILPDGTTITGINVFSVSINNRGQIAFLGSIDGVGTLLRVDPGDS